MPEITASKTPLRGFIQKLVLDKLVSEETAVTAVSQANAEKISLVKHLVAANIINSQIIAKAAAYFFGVPLLDIASFDITLVSNKIISEQLIRRHQVLPLLKRENKLFIALADPSNLIALNEIKFYTGLTLLNVIVEQDKLEVAIEQFLTAEEKNSLDDLSETNLEDLEITSDYDTTDADLKDKDDADDAPIVRYVNKVLIDAINKGASDIHFEPFEKNCRIRFRQDGLLYEIAAIPIKLGIRLISRLKVMSQLDISERRIPQDGRFKMVLSRKRNIDFRVSTCPTVHGEKVVMRILDPSKAALSIDALGMEIYQKELFLKAIQKPQGMILVTGPTGSGKTISLYTALHMLNTPEVNISTVEDPVEIQLHGANQVTINTKTGLTFSAALRAFLRQDPDIIMVGEMRDLETAEIAIKAAQTGHLVLSTLHTNSAPETLNRLLNMGIEAYNIATSVNLIMAQRLIRILCDKCRLIENVPAQSLIELGFNEKEITDIIIYSANPKGCNSCREGYKGRMGIYEVLPMTEKIAQIMLTSGNSIDVAAAAREAGMTTLRESGLLKVKQGFTSIAEINRVTKD